MQQARYHALHVFSMYRIPISKISLGLVNLIRREVPAHEAFKQATLALLSKGVTLLKRPHFVYLVSILTCYLRHSSFLISWERRAITKRRLRTVFCCCPLPPSTRFRSLVDLASPDSSTCSSGRSFSLRLRRLWQPYKQTAQRERFWENSLSVVRIQSIVVQDYVVNKVQHV